MADSIYGGVLGRVARAVDGAVATVAPIWGRNRLVARAERRALLAYDAAKSDRTRRSRETVESADDDLLADLPKLRSNSRTMFRDDASAAAIMQVMRENIIGTGIMPQSIVAAGKETGFTADQADEWNRACEAWFGKWARRFSDATEHTQFPGLQVQALTDLVRDGEFLCHRVAKPMPREIQTACAFIDVDRLQDPRGRPQDNTRSGVKIDAWGAAVGYYITPRHPSETWRPGLSKAEKENQPVFLHRYDGALLSILHGFVRTRAGQRRGVPLFSSSFGLIESLNDIVASEMVASRAASKIVMAITQLKPPGITPPGQEKRDDGQWVQKLESGTTLRLRPGEDMRPFVPGRPGNTWEAFVNRMLRSICSAFGLPYELVARDFAKMNYSSARVALQEARRTFEQWQQVIVEFFCRHWWEFVLVEGVLSSELPLPRFWMVNRDAYLKVMWVPPSWGYVDPAVEIEASRKSVEANLSTAQHEAARNGMDLEHILDRKVDYLVMCREKEKAAGLEPGALTAERAERIESVQTEKPAGDEPVDEKETEDEPVDNGGDQPGEQPESETTEDQ